MSEPWGHAPRVKTWAEYGVRAVRLDNLARAQQVIDGFFMVHHALLAENETLHRQVREIEAIALRLRAALENTRRLLLQEAYAEALEEIRAALATEGGEK